MTREVMGSMQAKRYRRTMVTNSRAHPGELLRQWRLHRRFSQLDLATRAEVSTRHLSFVETGRARPSPEMIVHLAEHLTVPLRDRNRILLAGGYAPRYNQTPLADPSMAAVRSAVQLVLEAHRYPAVVVDGRWNLVDMNAAGAIFTTGVDPELLVPPVNVIRMSLHPRGLAPRVGNLAEFAEHILLRVRHMIDISADAELIALYDEIATYAPTPSGHVADVGAVLPIVLTTDLGDVRMFSMIATFGTPLDVTIDELTIEAFYPMDDDSRDRLEQLSPVAVAASAGVGAGVGG